MKLNSKQLRKIILEVAKQRLNEEEGGSADVSGQVAEFVSDAFTSWLDDEGIDLITNNAWETMSGTLSDDEFVSPGRIEDVEHFAESAADKVLSDSQFRQKIVEICKLVLETSIEGRDL